MSRQRSVVVNADDTTVATMNERLGGSQWERRGTQTDFQGIADEAKLATEAEHKMGILEAIRTYPKAVGWSVLASTALVMEGYDLVVIGSFYGFPPFENKYGTVVLPPGSPSKKTLTAAWESGLSNGATVGEILGLLVTGLIADRFGYKFTIGLALCLVVCFIFITFFAVSVEMLLVGEILCGIPWGCFQTITTAYAAEVTPVQLRPFLTTYVNLCWVFGQFIGSGVLRGLVNRTDEWGYRIPFALQWMWPLPLLVGIIFAPESPWWLVRKGRYADAENSLRRLTSKGGKDFDASQTIAMMIHTNELEKQASQGTSYWDCFKGVNLRRTEIAAVTWMIQTLCGSGLQPFSTQFYEQAGLSAVFSFDFNMGQYALGAVGTVLSWFAMVHFGRRSLYLWGLVAQCTVLLLIGFVGLAPASNVSAPWAIGSMLLISTFIYDLTIGPVCYCLVAEISSTRLRGKTIVLARNFYNVVGIFNNIITPRMINPTAWNWGAKAGFFWGVSCFLCVVWTFFRLPEPKGKTYGELDILFERRVRARDFKNADVNPFHGDTVNPHKGSVEKVLSQDSAEKQDVVMDEKVGAEN